MPDNNAWVNRAVQKIASDFQRSADTHLMHFPLAAFPHQDIYFKDESTHPTGSLKHRLARSLFLYALCNGYIRPGMTIIEASSGSTAISEAYFARLLGLPFIAVMPKSTAKRKIEQIEFYGGKAHLVEQACEVYAVAQQLADNLNGYYIDQFTFAERATDWRGNNNIAESIFEQMKHERHPIPQWIVMSPGTGGTSATIGRYIRYCQKATQLCVVDPEHSVFHKNFITRCPTLSHPRGSGIEGIGRPRVEPSFIPGVIDDMLTVPDAVSVGIMRWLSEELGRKVGPSTGTNFAGILDKALELQSSDQAASLVTLLCDSGERYLDTYYNDAWVAENIGNIQPYFQACQRQDFEVIRQALVRSAQIEC